MENRKDNSPMPAILIVLAALCLVGTCGCQPSGVSTVPTATPASGSTSVSATGLEPTAPPSGTESVAEVAKGAGSVSAATQLSQKSIDYAKGLGGTSHKGDKLYFVIGDSLDTAAEADAKLQAALPRFGDAQVYFIVQKSDNFEGMRPGYWVLVEAYRESGNAAEGAQWAKRCFADCYVKPATVNTDDPIPVVEDLNPGM